MTSRRVLGLLAGVLLLVLGTAVVDGAHGLTLQGDHAVRIVANGLPAVVLMGVLLGLTGRVGVSVLGAAGAEAVFYTVSALKQHHLGEPLTPTDFRLVGQLDSGGELFTHYAPPLAWTGLILGVGLVGAAWWLEPRARLGPWWARLIGVAMGLGLLASIGWATWPTTSLYQASVLDMEPWSATATRQWDGLINMLALFQNEERHARPIKADPARVATFLMQTRIMIAQAQQGTPLAVRPDVVIVQSESLFDPGILAGQPEGLPAFARLAQTGMHGPLRVPTFGGGTIRTEFEVLSGLPLRAFAQLRFPYLQMTAKPLPGLMSVLKTHGYRTMALHGNGAAFWNRQVALKSLGVDQFVDLDQFDRTHRATDGTYLTDAAMTDEILARLPPDGPPLAMLAISIEAHGPYSEGVTHPAQRDHVPVPAGVVGDAAGSYRTYRYHALHADAALARLAQALAHRARPTVLVVYGDHLPGLVDVFEHVGFADHQPFLKQSPPYLLVALGPQAPAIPRVTQALPAWGLPGQVLGVLGLTQDPYYALTRALGPTLADLTHPPGAGNPVVSAAVAAQGQGLAELARLRWQRKDEPAYRAAGVSGELTLTPPSAHTRPHP